MSVDVWQDIHSDAGSTPAISTGQDPNRKAPAAHATGAFSILGRLSSPQRQTDPGLKDPINRV